MKRIWLLLAIIALSVPAQAQINSAREFDADFAYMEGFSGDALTVTSGQIDVGLEDVSGAFGFYETNQFSIDGVTRVCWQVPALQCVEGNLTIVAQDGSSIGIDFPGAVDGRFSADHALAMFVDFAGREDLNTYDVTQTLVAPVIGGQMQFISIAEIPFSFLSSKASMAGLVGLDASTVVEVREGSLVLANFTGKDTALSFEGSISIPTFSMESAIIPFEPGSEAEFSAASSEAAREGLKLERINQMIAAIDGSNSNEGSNNLSQAPGLADVEDVLAEVLNGASLRVPLSGGNFEDDFAVIRFDDMIVTSRATDVLDWEGSGPLAIQGSQVAGAPDLVGWKFLSLPWWSFLLWGLAIAAVVTRVSTKAPKKHEQWDRYKWVGWVFLGLSAIAVFVLWDFEVRRVWGTSLFSTDASGKAFWVTAAVQIAPLLYILFAVAAPLRMLMKNGLMIAKQGTFMGLSGGIALLMAYAFGATLLLAYIEIIITAVMESTGG